jgi:hypothetical protein
MQLQMQLQSNVLAGLRGLTVLLASGLALAACGADHDTDCLKGNGPVATERRALDRRLLTVTVYDNVDLTIVPDTATYAEVRAGENMLPYIEFSTPSGPEQLVIKNSSRCNWVRSYSTPREVRLHVANPHRAFHINQYGYGLISTDKQWAQDTLYMLLASTGDFNLDVRSTYLLFNSFDAGDITLRGTVEDFHPNCFSTGFLFASDLDTRYCYFATFREWRSDMHVRSHQNLGGTLAGTGRLFYSGNPGYIDVKGPNASNLFKN